MKITKTFRQFLSEVGQSDAMDNMFNGKRPKRTCT